MFPSVKLVETILDGKLLLINALGPLPVKLLRICPLVRIWESLSLVFSKKLAKVKLTSNKGNNIFKLDLPANSKLSYIIFFTKTNFQFPYTLQYLGWKF